MCTTTQNRIGKNQSKTRIVVLVFVGLACLGSCREAEKTSDPVIPASSPKLEFNPPAHFPAITYDLASNPVTHEGAELGRSLFNERLLSIDNQINCGSCHQQSAVFTHPAHSLSHGVGDRFTLRNSQPVMNLAWNSNFMWDGFVGQLDSFPLFPMKNHNEMDETPEHVVEKLRNHATYPARFEKVFGTKNLEIGHVLKALSQFMLVCVSANSRYDRYVLGKGEILSADELDGKSLFEQKCSSCHSGILFTDFSFRNNGLPIKNSADSGRFRKTHNPEDVYKFRVPSLRNIQYSGPYMHDGRILTLEGVIDHYRSGMVVRPNIDPQLVHNNVAGIPITDDEKRKLVAFLNTLTDLEFLTRKELSR